MKFQNNKRFEYRPNNIAMICYTGGTTGEPKVLNLLMIILTICHFNTKDMI